MMGVDKSFKVQPKQQFRERKACYIKVKSILDFDDSGADIIEMSDAKPLSS